MRALEREKAAAAGQRKAAMLAALEALYRMGDALQRGEMPAAGDVALYVAAMDRHRASGARLSLDRAFGLDGARGIADAVAHAQRDQLLREAHRRFLPGLRASVAARRIIEAQNGLARAARTGSAAPATAGLPAMLQRIAQLGRGVPGFRQLERILGECHDPPRANDAGPHVARGRGREDKTVGAWRDGRESDASVGAGDRRQRSGADGAAGAPPGAAAAAADRDAAGGSRRGVAARRPG